MEPTELANILTEAIQVKFERPDPRDYVNVCEERHWFLSKDKTEIEILSPSMFYFLRNINSVSTAELVDEWQNLFGTANLHGRPKSKSFFMFSRTNKYIMKTISRDESITLRRILPQYARYCSTNAGSFLNRYLLLVKIHKKSISPYKGYVIVTKNVFDQTCSIREIYDLKGREPKAGKMVPCTSLSTGCDSHHVLEDKNLQRQFLLNADDRKSLISQLQSDFEFLKCEGLMDYSILIGVLRLKDIPTETASDMNQMHDDQEYNVFLSRNAEEMYFIGIIDTLTVYGWKKRISNFFKSFIWDQQTLSTIAPDLYYKRLLMYSETIFPPSSPK